MREKVVIFGSGGHARVAIDTMYQSPSWSPFCCVSEQPGELLGVPIVSDQSLRAIRDQGVNHAFIAVGQSNLRARLAAQARDAGFTLATVVSPHAYVSPTAIIGQGVLVAAGAVVHPECRIGDLAIVNTRSSVDHECTIGTLSHVAPGATLCGNVKIGAHAWVGAGAVVLEGRVIANYVTIGAGAVVTRDILVDGTRAIGVPARFN